MDKRDLSFEELSEKLLEGARLAAKKLVVQTASNGETLVVRGKDGIIREVPAIELLKNFEQQP